jgi:hypothetical protein
MTLGSKENYINAAANYAWDELPQASTYGVGKLDMEVISEWGVTMHDS